MIRIKFEVEEEKTPLPIESENERIKRISSLKFFGNNLNNSTSDTNNGNYNNVCGILKQKSLPEMNGVVPKKVVVSEKKPKQLGNSTTNSFAAVGSKSIKTEPVESSLSLTTQLNNSLNIQSLLRQNRIQNGWTTNEQSIPIGTQQQQQQSLFSTKIEPIVPEIHQEVPLSLDQSSSSIPNFMEITTPATKCDTMENSGLRAGFGRSAKLNVCYSVPKEPKDSVFRKRKKLSEELPPITSEPPKTITTTIQWNSADVFGNSELTNNDNYSDQHSISDSGSISGVDPTSSSSSSSTALPEAAVPLLVGKKPLPLGVPPLTLLEEKKARNREYARLWYQRKKTSLKLMDPEAKAEILCKRRENNRKSRQRFLDKTAPEQLEQIRLKQLEANRRQRENENEEQRQQRLEREKQYRRTVGKQRLDQKRETMTPEEREKKLLKNMERYRREMEKESEEQRKHRAKRVKQYYNEVYKQRRELKRKTMTPEEREKKNAIQRDYYYKSKNRKLKKSLEESQIEESQQTSMSSSMSLVDISESSVTSTLNHHLNNHSSSTSTMTNDNNNNGIVEIGTIISKRMGKPGKKRLELSMSINSDLSDFDIDSGSGEESISQTTITTLEQSPKSGPSMKLPRPTRCQSNLK